MVYTQQKIKKQERIHNIRKVTFFISSRNNKRYGSTASKISRATNSRIIHKKKGMLQKNIHLQSMIQCITFLMSSCHAMYGVTFILKPIKYQQYFFFKHLSWINISNLLQFETKNDNDYLVYSDGDWRVNWKNLRIILCFFEEFSYIYYKSDKTNRLIYYDLLHYTPL